MSNEYNIYCDESCHLINDGHKCMVLGSLILPKEKLFEVSDKIKSTKIAHDMDIHTELKWVKASPNKLDLYKAILNIFLSHPDLSFRCVVVPDKSQLCHNKFYRTHDNFYYVMYYYGLRFIMQPSNTYNIYFDFKDHNQKNELPVLKQVLYIKEKIPLENMKLQSIQSYESQLMQMCDIITGAISYRNRGLLTSSSKTELANMLECSTHQDLCTSSVVREAKCNVFVWHARSLRGNNA